MRFPSMAVVSLLLAVAGCGPVKTRTRIADPPAHVQAQTATAEELIQLVNGRYAGLESLSVSSFEVEFTAAAEQEGYLENYRKANGYLVAARPESIFINILNPLTSSSVLTMAAHLGTFQVWIPTRNQFVTGQTDVRLSETRAIYNVRPSHLLPAVLVEPVPGPDPNRYFVEEAEDEAFRYYVLGVVGPASHSPAVSLKRKVWIERSRLELVRQQYYETGRVVSRIEYAGPLTIQDKILYREIRVDRPLDQYSMAFRLRSDNLKVNQSIKAEAFQIPQPPGAEVIQVEDSNALQEIGEGPTK